MHNLTNNIEQEFIISSKTLNKMIKILEDKPFKIVVDLLNEIKSVPFENNVVKNLDNNDEILNK